MDQLAIGFKRYPCRVMVIGERLDPARATEIAACWRRRWRDLQRFKRGVADLELSGSPEQIVRAKRGQATFVEVDEANDALPIPPISDMPRLATADLAEWEGFIQRYGLPVGSYGDRLTDSWLVRDRPGQPMLLRVPVKHLQVFAHQAALLSASVNALRGQTYLLNHLLRRVPRSVLSPYFHDGQELPVKENDVRNFACRIIAGLREEAIVEMVRVPSTGGQTTPAWDVYSFGWWPLVVLTALRGVEYREPRTCACGCDRFVPLERIRYFSSDCRNRYRWRMKKRRHRARAQRPGSDGSRH